MTAIEIDSIKPFTHSQAMGLLADELEQTLAMLTALDDHDWAASTDCPEWDVRRMYLHVLGACEAGARMRENVHQLRAARARRRRSGGPLEANLSAVQVLDRRELAPAQIVAQLAAIAPKTVRGRRRTPALVRNHAKLAVDGPVHERWTIGYLIDTIYLRDLWMHRVDASRATNRTLVLTADHDGRIVADVVAEWARRHGKPFVLELSGPAGGTYVHEPDSPGAQSITLDAVEFCRTLAGRTPATGLLATIVPF
ncbi:MAG: maleylpyruvate isomerase family mycothiol-dependent enzyme [Ilumatobacteraceae bacterium]